ncbi:hypothetical protein [Pseudofrankia sp. BMG5.37]|uniref:hypothetical protein n=1 Tax=Pseudofrankia sp. BMG5.37 TaxID=3050035 RepID=UPI0028954E63|nr:hypothetical protein [Pseudofrankia sp. BMG5.37]MDT3446044.1 hypothetical protein [Pseudofrankia sp. BMG5.37]
MDLLAKQLRTALGPRGADTEEGLRRAFRFPAEAGGTLELRDAVAGRLAGLVRPTALAKIGERGDHSSEPAAVLPSVPPSSPRPLARRPAVERSCEPVRGPFDQRRFNSALRRRKTAHDVFRFAPQLRRNAEQFERFVPLDEAVWSQRYWLAAQIASAASGVDIEDDFHTCPPGTNRFGAEPVGRGSTFVIGNAVHAVLQARYLYHKDSGLMDHDVVAENLVFYGAAGEAFRRPPEQLYESPDIEERPDVLGALAFALGLPPKRPLRPDLIDFTTGGIVEIKPIRSLQAGVLQLWQYVDNFNLAKFYDEKAKIGAQQVGQRLLPGFIPANLLGPIPLWEALTGHDRTRFGHLVATPYMLTGLPGIVFYTLSEKRDMERVMEQMVTVIGVAAGIILAIVVAAIAVAVLAEALSAAAAVAVAVANATEATFGGLALISSGGVTSIESVGAMEAIETAGVAMTEALRFAPALVR